MANGWQNMPKASQHERPVSPPPRNCLCRNRCAGRCSGGRAVNGERTRAAALASATADLLANHAMLALIEQAERRHVEGIARVDAILAKYETEKS